MSCHMPKASVVDANHAVMTDHRIPRIPSTAAPTAAGTMVAFLGAADDRAVGLAYAELSDWRARPYLLRATPQDWQVLLRLAVLDPDAGRAMQLYETLLRENPGETTALVNLGSLYAKAGRLTESSRLWVRALETNPAVEEAVLNLTLIRSPSDSRLILNRYLTFNPVSPKARARLAEIEKQER